MSDLNARRVGGSGGSAQTKPIRKRTPVERPSALQRAYATLGEEVVKQLQSAYGALDSSKKGKQQADGMILSLVKQNVPDAQVRAVFKVGGYKIGRLKLIKEGEDDILPTRDHVPPKHAFRKDDVQFFCKICSEWNTEDGYPCSHRGPRQYLVEPNVSWKKLWKRYVRQAEDAQRRPIGYCRFTQYVHFYFPGIRLSRSQTDVCDACVRIDTALLRRDLTELERSELLQEKAVHVEAAINQRRAMTQFVKEYVAVHAPKQHQPEEVIAEHIEVPLEERAANQREELTLQIQIDDFGGSLPLPVYGHKQPSADYYNSNLMLHNFVVADITTGRNAVYVYDERVQGKGADALCSLRMLHHLRVRERYRQNGVENPENSITLLQVLDNCVGQNKSRSVFMFYAMLSLVFYKKVVMLFLLPGHSHNTADRVVAWCKSKLKGENLYVPEQVVSKMNETTSVEAEFLDHCRSGHPFYCGWDILLARYFKRMPDGYTGNYFFEIDRGVVSIRHLVTTDDQEVKTCSLIGNGDPLLIKKAFLSDLVGEERQIDSVTMRYIRLQRQPQLTLTMKKRKSLAMKYFSIPDEYLAYFPAAPEPEPEPEPCISEETEPEYQAKDVKMTCKRKLAPGVLPPKKKVGRPRIRQNIESSRSILAFFKPLATDDPSDS